MKKQVLYIAAVVLFIAVIAVAAVVYNGLSPEVDLPEEPPTTAASGSPTVPTSDRTATDFAVQTRDGSTVRLSEHFGKPVVLNFWATWCGYCVEELPAFEEMYRAHGDEVTFMMINATDDRRETVEAVEAFLTANGYTFPVYYDVTAEAASAYGAYSIPLTVFIGADGQVAYVRRGAMNASQLAVYMESYLGIS
ncbi:MAG: TlpA family protein disulfide reductase [Clostridia bacterium]|nr:TlpA family protein disulfide reductase [Clostridia bacterium]